MRRPRFGTVYLIHFASRLHHAGHYVGWCGKGRLAERIDRHRSGRGARLLAALNQKGIEYNVERTWEGVDKDFERKVKRRKEGNKLCPVCNPNAMNLARRPVCEKSKKK